MLVDVAITRAQPHTVIKWRIRNVGTIPGNKNSCDSRLPFHGITSECRQGWRNY